VRSAKAECFELHWRLLVGGHIDYCSPAQTHPAPGISDLVGPYTIPLREKKGLVPGLSLALSAKIPGFAEFFALGGPSPCLAPLL